MRPVAAFVFLTFISFTSVGSGGANGGFNPLYQMGGPRFHPVCAEASILTFNLGRLCTKSNAICSSLCTLCVLCVSVVSYCCELTHHRDTEDTEIAQRSRQY